MDSVRNRTEAQTVLALHKASGILHFILEDFSSFINFHERKNILKTIEEIEEQVVYENEVDWLSKSLKMITQIKTIFKAFEYISIKMEWEDVRIIMILSEAELSELENQIRRDLKIE